MMPTYVQKRYQSVIGDAIREVQQTAHCDNAVLMETSTDKTNLLQALSCDDTDGVKIHNAMIGELAMRTGAKLSDSEIQTARVFVSQVIAELARERLVPKGVKRMPVVGPFSMLTVGWITGLLGRFVAEKFYAHQNRVQRKPAPFKCGDVLCISRVLGVYDHYGIYESDDRVYEYADEKGDFSLLKQLILKPFNRKHFFDPLEIRCSSLSKFIGKSDGDSCFALDFSETHIRPWRRCVDGIVSQNEIGGAPNLSNGDYHLYPRDEVVGRARQNIGLGKKDYKLLDNNCEHFALWCKTGISESYQARDIRHSFMLYMKNRFGKI